MTDKIPPAVQEAVQRIDAQILHHLGPVQDLKSQRNALMPISWLPAEILGRIFHEVRASYNGSRYDNDGRFSFSVYSREPSLQWISVSHVSQHWRNVAMTDASIWTDPPLKNCQWTMMMLERSRMATIPAISLQVEELDKCVVAALMPHIPRLSSLMIPKMARETLLQVLSGLPSIAPKLEALSISCFTKTIGSHSWCQKVTYSSYDEALVFPDNVLCHTPKLHRLQLNDIIIKANSPLLSNLTALSISGVPEKSKPTPQQFSTMLKSAPGLKKLILSGVCPSTESIQQSEWMTPVLMPYLKYVNIAENIPQLIYFFRIFSVTHLFEALTVRVKWTQESAPDLPILFAALDQPYLHSIIGSSTDVRRLEVGYDGASLFVKASKLSISEMNLEPHERQMAGHSARMTMWIDKEWDSMIDDEDSLIELTDILLSDLFNSLTWTGLYELDLTDPVYASPQLLASTFGTVLGARIIMSASYDNERLPLLIEALNHRPDTQSDGLGSMPPSFPDLQHMDLRYTTFIQGEERLEVLLKCLQQRHDCGIPLISLKFDHDLLEEQIVLKLKKYVKHIILTPLGSEHKVVDDYSPYKHTWYL